MYGARSWLIKRELYKYTALFILYIEGNIVDYQ